VDYASAAEVFAAIEALDADVAARLEAVARAQPSAAAFASSADQDRRRRFAERQRLAQRLGVSGAGSPAAAPVTPVAPDRVALRELRDAQQNLVHAHAEGLPALRDRAGVNVLARHLVDLAAQLTVIDLWIEAEDEGE
jgi:hypothetical protein